MKKKIIVGLVLAATTLAGIYFIRTSWKPALTEEQYFTSGEKYFGEAKYQEASIQYLNALGKNPRNREARFKLAQCYANANLVGSAAKELRTLLEYYPNAVPANLQMGNLYLAGGGTDPQLFRRAQDIAKQILDKDEGNVKARILSASADAGLNEFDKAVGQLQEVLKVDPNDMTAQLNLGTFLA